MSKTKYALQAEGKNTVIAYVLWCLAFVGLPGVHRLYLGRVGTGVLQFVMIPPAIAWLFFGLVNANLIFILIPVIGSIWWLVDGFFIPGMISEENKKRGLSSSAVIVTVEENPPKIG
jgi:TM2 domain-containing membrane protein YozV